MPLPQHTQNSVTPLLYSISLFVLSSQGPNSILYSLYPFSSGFLVVSLSLVLALLSLSPSPLFWPRDVVWTRGERVLWIRVGGGNENSWVLEPGRGDRYKVRTQLPIPHTHLPRERKKEGRRRSGEWKDTANEPLTDSQISCLPKAIIYKLLVINTCILVLS